MRLLRAVSQSLRVDLGQAQAECFHYGCVDRAGTSRSAMPFTLEANQLLTISNQKEDDYGGADRNGPYRR